MKIAFCLEYPIGQAGGVSILVLTLIRELAGDYEIILVSPDSPLSLAQANLGNVVSKHIQFSPQELNAENAAELAEKIAATGVRLAHFHFGGNFAWNNRFPARCPIPYLAKRGVPILTTIHMAVGLLHGYCGPQKPLLVKLGVLPFAWINKLRVLCHVRREITVSRHDLNRLQRWYWPVRKKFTQIYHSRINSKAEPSPQSERNKTILGVGHIAQRKGQAVLAEAFVRISERHPDWQLLLAGHAAEQSFHRALEQTAKRTARAGQIQLLGQRNDAGDLMRDAAIYVQPSFHEGLPLSLQEALHNGCACIATNIPGNIELVENERNGLLVPAGDVAAMAAALEQMISNAELRSQFAKAGCATIRALEMTTAQMTQKHRDLYASVLNQA